MKRTALHVRLIGENEPLRFRMDKDLMSQFGQIKALMETLFGIAPSLSVMIRYGGQVVYERLMELLIETSNPKHAESQKYLRDFMGTLELEREKIFESINRPLDAHKSKYGQMPTAYELTGIPLDTVAVAAEIAKHLKRLEKIEGKETFIKPRKGKGLQKGGEKQDG